MRKYNKVVRRSALLLCTSSTALMIAVSCQVHAQENTAADTSHDTVQNSEIVVTASRRSQVLQDIPYNISALGAATLEKSGVTSLNNLAQAVPGLQNVDTGPNTRGGNSNFSMRGLRTDAPGSGGGIASGRSGTVASVSTYLGETPIFFPLAIKDLDRVEVLKGPQGTLYGSGAQAGTIRLIPRRPAFDRLTVEANAQGGISERSKKGNYSADGVINLPLTENLAVRIGAGIEHLGGFIDAAGLVLREQPGNWLSAPVKRVPSDPYSGYSLAPVRRDTNSSDQLFVRAALRWKPLDAVDVQLSYMHQYTHADDIQASNPNYAGGSFNFGTGGFGDPADPATIALNNPNASNTYRPGGKYVSTADALSPSTSKLDLASLEVSVDLGFATITSASSAYRAKSKESTSYTSAPVTPFADGSYLNLVAISYLGFPRFTAYSLSRSRDQAFTQEARLVSNGDGPFSYLLGAYYQAQDFNSVYDSYEPGIAQYVTEIGGTLANPDQGDRYYANLPFSQNGFKFRDKALFGEATYKITPEWQVTGGVRFFWQSFRSLNRAYAFFCGAACSVDGTDPSGLALDVDNTSKVNDHIIKINTSYDFSPSFKVYATYSEGFRRGGANTLAAAGSYASMPQYSTFRPDVAKNYEVGIKGSLLGGSLRYDADVFLIDLENFQFNGVSGSLFPAVFNGTTARSKGIETNVEWRASQALTLRASYNYTDAKVREGFELLDYNFGALLPGFVSTPDYPAVTVAQSVPRGASLPGVSKHNVIIGGDYTIDLGNSASVNLHADGNYKSSSPGTLDVTSPYYWRIPSSFIANARVSYNSGKAWSADLFVNNLTNDTAFSGGVGPQTVSIFNTGRYVSRPRTWGAALHVRY